MKYRIYKQLILIGRYDMELNQGRFLAFHDRRHLPTKNPP